MRELWVLGVLALKKVWRGCRNERFQRLKKRGIFASAKVIPPLKALHRGFASFVGLPHSGALPVHSLSTIPRHPADKDRSPARAPKRDG